MNYTDLAKSWIELQYLMRHKKEIPQNIEEANLMMWPALEVIELSDKYPSKCMEFIVEVLKQTDDEWIFANLAAGPLEDLLALHPEEGLVLLEKIIPHNSKLKRILGGVWQSLMSEETWQRLQKLRV